MTVWLRGVQVVHLTLHPGNGSRRETVILGIFMTPCPIAVLDNHDTFPAHCPRLRVPWWVCRKSFWSLVGGCYQVEHPRAEERSVKVQHPRGVLLRPRCRYFSLGRTRETFVDMR